MPWLTDARSNSLKPIALNILTQRTFDVINHKALTINVELSKIVVQVLSCSLDLVIIECIMTRTSNRDWAPSLQLS